MIENTFVCVNFCCIKNPDELFFCILAIILVIFFSYLLFEPISVPSLFLFSYVVDPPSLAVYAVYAKEFIANAFKDVTQEC